MSTPKPVSNSNSSDPKRFDKAYYDRFYRNPATRAVTTAQVKRQATFIASYLRYLEMPVKRIVDLGCGLGRLLDALQAEFPRASCTGVEVSEYLCKKHGWTHSSVAKFRPKAEFDLVVCNDVLSYLSNADCDAAIKNIANISRGAAFVAAPTLEDWEQCDPDRTDAEQVLRSTKWYRQRLHKHFASVGGGLLLTKPVDVNVWSLDQIGS